MDHMTRKQVRMHRTTMNRTTRMGRSLVRSTLVTGVMTGLLWSDGRAQEADAISYGLKAGVNAASFLNEDSEDSGRRYGLTAGAFMDVPLGSTMGLRVEALYTQKGLTSGDNTVAVDYIEIPVVGKFGLGSGGMMPFLYGGTSVGFNVSGKLKSGSDSVDYGELVNGVESSLIFGGGLDFAAGDRTVGLDLRYTMGLTSVFDFGDPSDSDSDDRNQGISLSLGISL